MKKLKSFATKLIEKIEWNSIDTKILKAQLWTKFNFPRFYFESKKLKKFHLFKEKEFNYKLNEKLLENLLSGIPKDFNNETKLLPIEYLQNYFDENTLKNEEIFLILVKHVGKSLQFTHPWIAIDFIDKAIVMSKKLFGKYNSELIYLFRIKEHILHQLGNIDDLYNTINEVFLITLSNYQYNSLETIECLESFRKFSFLIEEKKEHESYCLKMFHILNNLIKEEKTGDSVYLLFHFINFIESMTNFNGTYSVENIKKISQMYQDLTKTNLFKQFLNNVNNLNINSNSNNIEIYLRIVYCNIKIKYFLKKDKDEKILNEMYILINSIKTKYGEFHQLLILPYLFLIKHFSKFGEKEQLDNFIYDKWFNLLENLYQENLLAIANNTLILVNSLLDREKDYKVKLSNLIDYTGEIYNKIYNFSKNESISNTNFLYAEICYIVAYLLRDEVNMNPWETVSSACEIYYNILGGESEKYKKSLKLLENIKKKYKLK